MSHKSHREYATHSLRVAHLCYDISSAKDMSGDKRRNAYAAGVLHDYMKPFEQTKKEHAKLGKQLAKAMGLDESICDAIGTHNAKKSKILKQKNVAKILFVADKLEQRIKPKYRNKQKMFDKLHKEAMKPTGNRPERVKSLNKCIEMWFVIKNE